MYFLFYQWGVQRNAFSCPIQGPAIIKVNAFTMTSKVEFVDPFFTEDARETLIILKARKSVSKNAAEEKVKTIDILRIIVLAMKFFSCAVYLT